MKVGASKKKSQGLLFQLDVVFLAPPHQERHLEVEDGLIKFPRGRFRDHLELQGLCGKVQFGRGWSERGRWNILVALLERGTGSTLFPASSTVEEPIPFFFYFSLLL